MRAVLTAVALVVGCGAQEAAAPVATGLPRVVVELQMDAGAEASLVRMLFYLDQVDVAALVVRGADDAAAVARVLDAYARVRPALARTGLAFPAADEIAARVRVDDGADGAVAAVSAALDGDDTTALWYLRFAAEDGRAPVLARALDRIRATGRPEDYRRAAGRVRFVGAAAGLGEHDRALGMVLDTAGDPGRDFERQSAAALAAAGGDVDRRLRSSPFAALHPPGVGETGAAMFLGLLAAGPGVAEQPGWGGWGGRFEPHPNAWSGWWRPAATDAGRDDAPIDPFTRWTAAIQDDFAARLAWSAGAPGRLNHPPEVAVGGDRGATPLRIYVKPDDSVTLSADGSVDPDGDHLRFEWIAYPEAGTYLGRIAIDDPAAATITIPIATDFTEGRSFHLILKITDDGSPPLTRYRRVVLHRGG